MSDQRSSFTPRFVPDVQTRSHASRVLVIDFPGRQSRQGDEELRRAEALLGRSLQVASFEPYWKIEGEWRCKATAQIPAASAAELITNALLLANRLAYQWSVLGPHLDQAGKLESFDGTFQVGPGQKTKLSSLVWANFAVSERPFEPWGGKPPPEQA